MTPRIGASWADRSTALAPGLDRPGVNPVPRTGASQATGPPGLEHPGGSGKQTSAWNPDWNVRGSNAPGLKHPGGGSPGPERPETKQPWIGTSRATEGGGNRGGEKRRGEHEQEQGTAEGGAEEQEWGRVRGRRRRRSRQTHLTPIGTSGEAMHPDWNIRLVEALDWKARGVSNPGMEQQGSIRRRKRRRQQTARRT